MTAQLDLFALGDQLSRKRPQLAGDASALIRRLREADSASIGGFDGYSRAAIKRLMTPLPRITVLD